MKEEFRDIEGYEGLYQVSNLGRVKSIARNTTSGRILKPQTDRGGYQQVWLCKDGKQKGFLVHRLVAFAFLPTPMDPNETEVNHKDENPANNCVENIEWCTPAYNNNYGSHNERVAKALTGVYNTKRSKPVFQYSISGEFIREWVSSAEVNRVLGINRGDISKCCNGKLKTSGGFVWQYS